jgi:hypothetical protein
LGAAWTLALQAAPWRAGRKADGERHGRARPGCHSVGHPVERVWASLSLGMSIQGPRRPLFSNPDDWGTRRSTGRDRALLHGPGLKFGELEADIDMAA